jgi:hypothetical protein
MTRALRFQYPAAIYHVMARGDEGKTVFENKDDCEVFLRCLVESLWQLRVAGACLGVDG